MLPLYSNIRRDGRAGTELPTIRKKSDSPGESLFSYPMKYSSSCILHLLQMCN